MSTFIWVGMATIILMTVYMLAGMIYSSIVMYKQSKEFISNLNVGDETQFGKISKLDGDYVIINREPLKIHKSDIRPKKFKVNKWLFIMATKDNT